MPDFKGSKLFVSFPEAFKWHIRHHSHVNLKNRFSICSQSMQRKNNACLVRPDAPFKPLNRGNITAAPGADGEQKLCFLVINWRSVTLPGKNSTHNNYLWTTCFWSFSQTRQVIKSGETLQFTISSLYLIYIVLDLLPFISETTLALEGWPLLLPCKFSF